MVINTGENYKEYMHDLLKDDARSILLQLKHFAQQTKDQKVGNESWNIDFWDEVNALSVDDYGPKCEDE